MALLSLAMTHTHDYTYNIKPMESIENKGKRKSAQINNALGIFILYFGIVVIIAMFFTGTFVEKMTDLAAGSLLSAIGIGMMITSRIAIKRLDNEQES